MGIFTKTKSKPVMVAFTPHYCNGHPDHLIPLLKKAGVVLINPEDYIEATSGENLWVSEYLLLVPEHLVKGVMKLADKKKTFTMFSLETENHKLLQEWFPDPFEKVFSEQRGFIIRNR